MHLIKKLLPKLIITICLLTVVSNSFAQDISNQKVPSSSANQLVILIGIIAVILAFVIYGMGQVLITLGRQLVEKNKQTGKILGVVLFIGFTLCYSGSDAQVPSAIETVKTIPNYGGLNNTGFWILVTILIAEIIVIASIMFFIQRLQAELLPRTEQRKWFAFKKLWSNLDKKLFTKAIAVEKEADVLLDHDYDGIRELDNALPPWWKYGFLITIAVALVYMVNFHVLGYGKNPTEEYMVELKQAQEDKEAYEAKNKDKVDESNLTMPDADGINSGKEIFTTACWACHGKQGEGGAGPNLTDDYWLHNGSLSDVYQTIKHGYPDKGMQAWEKNYSPKEIVQLAGFIKSLRGTNPPNAKAPQGELFTETNITDTISSGPVTKFKTDTSGFKNPNPGIN